MITKDAENKKMSPFYFVGLEYCKQRDYAKWGDIDARSKPDKIIHEVLKYYDLTKKELISNSRKREIVFARQVCAYLMAHKTKLFMREIADKIGGKDRTTALYSRDTMQDLIDTDKKIKLQIKELIDLIK